LGCIGQALSRKVQTCELQVLGIDPFVSPQKARDLGVKLVDLETLCRESDYISLHVPLLPETRHLMGRPQFEIMKPTAILVNTSRGSVVDTAALLEALEAGHLAQAGLDVFETEPLPSDSPFRRHPKIVVTDHMAWYSEESQAQLQRTAAEEVVRVCTGELPMAVANPEVLIKLGRFQEWNPPESLRWKLKYAGLEK
jgi:D-3-phosphoglycerate dehydrogenase